MGKSLPIFNGSSLSGALGSFQQQVTNFFTPTPQGDSPYDGRTVDDFKPYLVALNLTKRCNLKCDHCYLDATTKAAGGNDELSTALGEIPFVECYPELWVVDNEVHPRARLLLDQWLAEATGAGAGEWDCPRCGERSEGQFDACWRCGSERPQG